MAAVNSKPQTFQFDFTGKDAVPRGEIPEEILTGYRKMSAEDFETLQAEIFIIQAKLAKQEELTLEEEKKINIWYRERRGIAISLLKEKPVKAAKATAAKKPAVKKKTAAAKAAEVSADIFKDLFG